MRYTIPLLLAAFCPLAPAITIDWATSQTSTGVTSPANALGAPNGLNAALSPTGLLTVSQFLQAITYNDATLAAALNLASLPVFNVILLEFNGTPGVGWEASQFSFTSGGPAVNMQVNSGGTVGFPINYVVGAGAINPSAYQSIFGAAAIGAADIPYLLFDLSASGVNVNSPSFQLSVNGFNGSTPDPDAIGVVPGVPEPSTAVLLLSAVAVLARLKASRGPSASTASTDNRHPESR